MKKILSLLVVLMTTVVSSFADTTPDYLCFTAEEAGAKVGFGYTEFDGLTPSATLCYQTVIAGTSSEWFDYTYGNYITLTNVGDKVYFKAQSSNATFSNKDNFIALTGDGKVAASGNVMSLLDATCQQKSVPEFAFSFLFYQCDNLTTAPELPATTLAKDCYAAMFDLCTSLTKAPDLPATTMAEECYDEMFKACTSLTEAPDLPATTMAEYCYYAMFDGCTSLTKAPDLPATELEKGCYENMFKGCSNLKSVSASFTDWNVEESTDNWLSGVASSGVFFCPTDLDVTTRGESNIPTDWVVNPDVLCFTAGEADAKIAFNIQGNLSSTPSIQYSSDRTNWTDYKFDNKISLANAGDKVYFKATSTNSTFSDPDHYGRIRFTSDKKVAASGNIMSLLDETCTQTSVPNAAFEMLFESDENLNRSQNYNNYLTEAPELPATELGINCYADMFGGCVNLTKAPELPATGLAEYCYYKMFYGCTNITALELPATTLVNRCYDEMFMRCSKLNKIRVAFTNWNDNCTGSWLNAVASTGTFICPNALEIKTGSDYIPEGWAIKTSGTFDDDDIKWDYDGGELTLTCTVSSAYMPDFDDATSAPWSKYDVKKIYIDPKIKGIGKYNFANCTNLTKMYIGGQIVSVYEHAFVGCTSLDSVFSSRGDLIIQDGAFPSNPKFYVYTNSSNWQSYYGSNAEETEFMTYLTEDKSLIYDSKTSVNCIDNVSVESNHNLTVGEHSKYNPSNLKLNLPIFDDWGRDCKIVALADNAFKGCSFAYANLPTTLQSVGEDAFTGCYALNTVTFRSVPSFANTTDLSTFGKEGTKFNFALTDDSYVAANSTVSGATSATYTRSMTNTWGTIVLPFEVKSDDAVEYYKIDGIEDGALMVSKYETLPAGTPALVKKLSGDAIASAATSTSVSTSLSNITGTVAMTGSYTNDTKVTDDNAYYIKDNKFWLNNEYFYIDAFRAYFTYNGSGAKSAFLSIDDMATAINALTGESTDVKVEAIYDAAGMVRSQLGNGLNIVKLSNGKTQKILVK